MINIPVDEDVNETQRCATVSVEQQNNYDEGELLRFVFQLMINLVAMLKVIPPTSHNHENYYYYYYILLQFLYRINLQNPLSFHLVCLVLEIIQDGGHADMTGLRR